MPAKWIQQGDDWFLLQPRGGNAGGHDKGHGNGHGKQKGKGLGKGQGGKGNGKSQDKGKGKGQGKNHGDGHGSRQRDRSAGAARAPKPREAYVLTVPCNGKRYEMQPGTYIVCGGCNEWVYVDKAGPGCEQCGLELDWQGFFERRTPLQAPTAGAADSATGGAQSAPAAPRAQGNGQTAEVKAAKVGGLEEEAVNKAYREERDTRQGITDMAKKLGHEEQGLAGLCTGLERIVGQLKEQLEKIRVKKGVIHKLQEEQVEAEGLLEKRKADRATAVASRSAAQAARVGDTATLLDESTTALAGTGSSTSGVGSSDPPPVQLGVQPGAAASIAAGWAPVTHSQWAPVIATAPDTAFSDSGGVMDKVNYDDEEEWSDAETEVEVAINSIGDWNNHMVRWVFSAPHGEPAPAALVLYYCGEGKDAAATATALGKVVDEIRDKCWTERLGEATDLAAIQAEQDAGNMVKAYEMREAQGLYAADKFRALRDELLHKLDQGMETLNKERSGRVKEGKFVATANVKMATKRGVKKTKGAKTKQGEKASAQVNSVREAKLKAALEVKDLKDGDDARSSA